MPIQPVPRNGHVAHADLPSGAAAGQITGERLSVFGIARAQVHYRASGEHVAKLGAERAGVLA
nr:hypothetical protein [Tropicimonas isoalkanivorans]